MSSQPVSTDFLPEAGPRISSLPRRRPWGWFSLVWLMWLIFPVLALFEQNRTPLEYVYGLGVLGAFVGVFVWAFLGRRWMDGSEERPFRIPSLIGMATSYLSMGLLIPLIGWNGIGMVIYAGSFAGVQRSLWPLGVAVAVSGILLLVLGLKGEIQWLTVGLMLFSTIVAALANRLTYREAIISRSLERSQEEVARVAKIAERERIARDLHDLLGHTLSVIVLKSELASRLAEKDPARAAREIRDVERIARESLQEVRSAVRGYRSSGLEGELEGVRLACEAANLKLELYRVPLELEWALEQTLAFVLREAVTNAIRHAGATKLWVSLERTGRGVRLSVWDDGSGRILEGNGIRGMRERVQALGGSLELDARGKGVTALVGL